MQNTTTQEAITMTKPTLIDRERTNGKTEWIKECPGYFISHREDGDSIWISRRPYGINSEIAKFPAEYEPTLEDIEEALREAGH